MKLGDPAEDVPADLRVLLHFRDFRGRQPPRLAEDQLRDADLAHVVQQSAQIEPFGLMSRHAGLLRQALGDQGHSIGMAAGVGILCVNAAGQGVQHAHQQLVEVSVQEHVLEVDRAAIDHRMQQADIRRVEIHVAIVIADQNDAHECLIADDRQQNRALQPAGSPVQLWVFRWMIDDQGIAALLDRREQILRDSQDPRLVDDRFAADDQTVVGIEHVRIVQNGRHGREGCGLG